MKRHPILLPLMAAILLSGCTLAPAPEINEPRVVGMDAVASQTCATLSATFDHAGNIVQAGFELQEGSGRTVRQGGDVAGTAMTATVEGLEPDTEYSYAVYFTNGRQETVSGAASFRTLKTPEKPDNPDDPVDPPAPDDPVDPPAPDDPIDPASFNPNLLKLLLKDYDADGDGSLTTLELLAVEELNLSDILLEDTRGLELLQNLRSASFGYNWLQRLDVSANKKLEFLSAGGDNHLTEIYLDNPELVQTYFLGPSGVRSLDFTRCPKIYICEWWDFPVQEVDFCGCEDLHAVRIGGSRLGEIDLSDAWKLRHLNVAGNPELKTIRLKKGVELESLEYDPGVEIIYE